MQRILKVVTATVAFIKTPPSIRMKFEPYAKGRFWKLWQTGNFQKFNEKSRRQWETFQFSICQPSGELKRICRSIGGGEVECPWRARGEEGMSGIQIA